MARVQEVLRLHSKAMEVSADFFHFHLNVSVSDESDSLLGRRHFRQHYRSEVRGGLNQSVITKRINLCAFVRNYRTRYNHLLSIYNNSVPAGKPVDRHENGRLR